MSEIARIALAHDFPVLFEHKAWWVSPALHALVNLPGLLVDDGSVPDDGASRLAPLLQARPPAAWLAAIAAALLSGIGAAWWTAGARMAPRARRAWCLACVAFGPAGLLSLAVLQSR